jgi:hypothetical protein
MIIFPGICVYTQKAPFWTTGNFEIEERVTANTHVGGWHAENSVGEGLNPYVKVCADLRTMIC